MFPHDRFADRGEDFPDRDLPAVGTLDLLDHDQLLLLVLVEHAECGAAVPSQRWMAILHCVFDVLWVMVDPANDDQVLDPACDVKLAVLAEEAEITGPQPAFGAVALDARAEYRRRRLEVAPIPLRDMRPRNPHLA